MCHAAVFVWNVWITPHYGCKCEKCACKVLINLKIHNVKIARVIVHHDLFNNVSAFYMVPKVVLRRLRTVSKEEIVKYFNAG